MALRRGTVRPPTAKTIAEAAEVLTAGAHDGTILDRAGKPYKPSAARGYEQLLQAYVIPALGAWKLSELQRHLVSGGEEAARERLDAYLNSPNPTPTVAHEPQNEETPVNTGVLKYRYRDSKLTSEA